MFVAIEGIEGSGKSTLQAGLAQQLRSDGYDVLVTREPGGTPAGDAIREIFLQPGLAIEALGEAFLVNGARVAHVERVIRPAVAAGRIVVSDRFTDSTLAYQGYGRGVSLDVLRALCAIATSGLEPELVLLLDLPLEIARARLGSRGKGPDRIEIESDAFHQRVRDGFLELARSPRHHVLDGTLPADEIVKHALDVVRERMRVRVS